jgi:transposase
MVPEETRACIDEGGINKPLVREYERAPRGVRLEDVKSGRKFQRTNVVATRIGGGIAAPLCYSGNTTSASFVEWFRTKFVKAVPKGTSVIMDNASFYPPKKLKNPCRRHGMGLLFLSAYSPDYNPIEKSRANMKRALIDIIPPCEDVPAAVYQYFGVDIS